MATPKLLIVDGTNVVRRVYEAGKGPKGDKPGAAEHTAERAEGALKSSWFSIRRAIKEHQPTHFFAAFDHGGTTWRHELYPDYKANRTPTPEPLRAAMPGFLEWMNNTGLRSMTVPGFEADDAIATLAVKAAARGFKVVVLSTDKDMCALLDQGVEVRDHYTPEWRDAAYVQRRFGVAPHQLLDLLALMGDDSDGIPGLDGIGPTTAAKLLGEHGSLEAVLAKAASIEGIKGKIGERLRHGADFARLCRALTEMRLDAPMGSLTPRELQLPADLLASLAEAPSQSMAPGSVATVAAVAAQANAARAANPAPASRRVRP